MKIKLLWNATFVAFPKQKVSTVRWGIFATLVSIATFFIGLSVAMIGIQLTLPDPVVWLWYPFGLFMVLGLLFAGYVVWLGHHYVVVGSNDPTGTKNDLLETETHLATKIDDAFGKSKQ